MKEANPMSDNQSMNQTISEHQSEGDLAGKYLTFRLGDEEFGVEILKVREIIGLMDITVVPRTPRSIRGVINLRGKIIPVVDLRLKFMMQSIEDTELSCIIVVDTSTADGQATQMGILVDTVSEVLDIPVDLIEPTPAFGSEVNTKFIRGMARVEDTVKILLSIEEVLSHVDLTAVDEANPAKDVADENGPKSGPDTNIDEAIAA
jgi:purine-binding chemotaxis protein CheW